MPQWTTVATDLILAAATFGPGFKLGRTSRPGHLAAAFGLCIVGTAALLGAIRYAGLDAIADIHLFVSQMGGAVGTPMLGVATAAAIYALSPRPQLLAAGILFAGFALDAAFAIPGYRTIAGGLGMVLCIAMGAVLVRRGDMTGVFAIAGAILIAIAGLVIGSRGDWNGILRVDLFHVTLAAGYVSIATCIARTPTPPRAVP